MSDLRDLYQDVILDHSRRPRNSRPLPGATHQAEGYNPLCGDRITVYLVVEDGLVRGVSFQGAGCAISTASASLMTESIKGKRVEEAEELFRRMHGLLTSGATDDGKDGGRGSSLGKLEAFSGVREFPVRVKCATLAWHTLRAALRQQPAPVTTE